MVIEMNKKYTDEQVAYIIKLCQMQKFNGQEIADQASAEFGIPFKKSTIHDICNRRGYHIKSKIFTDDIKAYIAEVAEGKTSAEVSALVKEKFGKEITPLQIRRYKQNHHIKSGVDTTFKKGNIPYSKGKPNTNEAFRKHMFKKGHMPKNYQPIGTVSRRESKPKENGKVDAAWYIKIADPNKWQLFNRYLWEHETGEKLTDRDLIIYLDGNIDNNNPSNLMKIDKSIHAIMNNHALRYDDAELTKCGVTIAMLKKKTYEIKKKGKKKHE